MVWNESLKNGTYSNKIDTDIKSLHVAIKASGVLTQSCKDDFDGCTHNEEDDTLFLLFKKSKPVSADVTELNNIVGGY